MYNLKVGNVTVMLTLSLKVTLMWTSRNVATKIWNIKLLLSNILKCILKLYI